MRAWIAAVVLASIVTSPALAQDRPPVKPAPIRPVHPPASPPHPPPVIEIGGLQIEGKLRSVSLLQFLERAREELERSQLERRSFVPALVRSVDEEAL